MSFTCPFALLNALSILGNALVSITWGSFKVLAGSSLIFNFFTYLFAVGVPGWTVRGHPDGRWFVDGKVPAESRGGGLRRCSWLRPETDSGRLERSWSPLQLLYWSYAWTQRHYVSSWLQTRTKKYKNRINLKFFRICLQDFINTFWLIRFRSFDGSFCSNCIRRLMTYFWCEGRSRRRLRSCPNTTEGTSRPTIPRTARTTNVAWLAFTRPPAFTTSQLVRCLRYYWAFL